jgi:hypothetical protein
MTDDALPGTRDRGFVVAAVRALGPRAENFCGRRDSALRRHAALLYRDRERYNREATRLDRPVPAGIGEVHPTWYEAPPSTERAAARAWLERLAYGHLVEMEDDEPQPALLDRLARRDAAELGELLVALGRRRVAVAFSGAPRGALAQLCARLGEPAASELLAQVRAVAPQVGSDEVHAAQRALFALGLDTAAARLDGDGPRDARALFLRAGCAWLGPALAARGDDRLRRVAQRLPRTLGAALLDGARATVDETDGAAASSAAAALLSRARARR